MCGLTLYGSKITIYVTVTIVSVISDIDSLLDTLKSLSNNEEDEDLKILEDMLKSTTFKKAKHVRHYLCFSHLNLLCLSLLSLSLQFLPILSFILFSSHSPVFSPSNPPQLFHPITLSCHPIALLDRAWLQGGF